MLKAAPKSKLKASTNQGLGRTSMMSMSRIATAKKKAREIPATLAYSLIVHIYEALIKKAENSEQMETGNGGGRGNRRQATGRGVTMMVGGKADKQEVDEVDPSSENDRLLYGNIFGGTPLRRRAPSGGRVRFRCLELGFGATLSS